MPRVILKRSEGSAPVFRTRLSTFFVFARAWRLGFSASKHTPPSLENPLERVHNLFGTAEMPMRVVPQAAFLKGDPMTRQALLVIGVVFLSIGFIGLTVGTVWLVAGRVLGTLPYIL